MKQRLKKNESGRSMVEMLGVLAVIGVLSVGGISGYSYAMKRQRISQTINQLAVAMQSARGLALRKIDDVDMTDSGCAPIRYVMQGAKPCPTNPEDAFQTAIGACVSVCRDERNIWSMELSFDNVPPEDIITPDDCRTILGSEVAREGFLSDNGIASKGDEIEMSAVCDMFANAGAAGGTGGTE